MQVIAALAFVLALVLVPALEAAALAEEAWPALELEELLVAQSLVLLAERASTSPAPDPLFVEQDLEQEQVLVLAPE